MLTLVLIVGYVACLGIGLILLGEVPAPDVVQLCRVLFGF